MRMTVMLLAASLAGAAPAAARADTALPDGVWRAEVDHYGRTLPFNFAVSRDGGELTVEYLNGPERMPVEEVRYDAEAGRLELNFPSYAAGLEATVADGRLDGTIVLQRRDRVIRLPVTAEHGADWRFFPEPVDEYADVAGRWEVEIEVPAFGFSQPAMALLEQDGPWLTGTVLTQVGDFRYLFGEVRGRELYLSTFDGGGTQMWTAELGDDGTLAGQFDSVTYGNALWRARRNPAYELEDPTSLTYLKPGYDGIDFEFPDLDGNPVSLSDPRFDGKVVLVVISASWCSTCHDEAKFMGPLYETRHDRGLEVVYLMFEYSDVFAEVEDQLLAFRDRYDIEHPILFAGDAARQGRGELLPMLNDIVAFPTTLFIDRRGKVRRIYTAFPGPATGQVHEDYKREFRTLVDLLLDEPA